jgi:pimeloyl-ACP methyl ester carboxylesterase
MARDTLILLGLSVLGAICALGVATWMHLRYWSKRLTLALDYTFAEELTAEDGGVIELRRVPLPEGAAAQPLPPVLLVHGIAANHRNQDVHPDYSLARYLAALGRDVWLLTLRSGRRPRSRKERARQRFGAMVRYDLPLAFSTIRQRTGKGSLDYVGFSMGGMLLYAAIGRSVPAAWVRRAVIVGSPGLVRVSRWLRPLLRTLPRALIPTLPLRTGARAIAFASEWFRTPLHSMICNPLNVSPGITRAALVNVIEDIPGALNADFTEWAANDGHIRTGEDRALDGLEDLRTPALFMAGKADRIAPISSVRAAFDAWGKRHPDVPKRFVVVGRDFGHHEDYGHGDLALGAHVGVDLFEPIAKFLGPEGQPQETKGPEVGAAAREDIRERAAVA